MEQQTPGKTQTGYGRKIPLTYEEQRTLVPASTIRTGRPKKRFWLMAIVAAAAVIGGFVGYSLLTPNQSNSPEDAFRGLVNAINAGDAEAAVEFTVDAFLDDVSKSASISQVEALWAEEGGMTITIHSIQVVYRSDMVPAVSGPLDAIVTQVETLYDVDVKDSCAVVASTTTLQAGEEFENEGDPLPMVKVGQDWYVATVYVI